MANKKVLVSQGLSVLHFPDVVSGMQKKGNLISYLTGWVPNPYQKPVVNFIGNVLGKNNLYNRLMVRKPPQFSGLIIQLKVAEAYYWILIVLSKLRIITVEDANYYGWCFFGKSSAKYIGHQDIFHVRSGAGQGGAIAKAKEKNVKVIADHSIAHPASMEKFLLKEYKKFGLKLDLNPNDKFWDVILKDCEDSDYILVNSDFVAKSFIENGVPADKLKTIYWGVRHDFIGLKHSWKVKQLPRLVFTGTFGIRKGAHILIEAINILNNEGCLVTLDIAGPDEFTTIYKHSLPKNVNMLGNLLQDDLKALLINSDVYVFPTFAEGCARSVMEAMAIGIPVITTQNSGAPIIDNVSGFIVPAGDAEALAQAIKYVIGNEGQRAVVGKNSCLMIKTEYNWDNYNLHLNEFYNDVLKRKF